MNKREFLCGVASGILLPSVAAAQAVKPTFTPTPVRTAKPLPPLSNDLTKLPEFAPHGPIPKSYIDAKTGHKVVRLSGMDHAAVLYFNDPAFSPDGKWMVFNRLGGISVVNMDTLEEKNLYSGRLHAFAVSKKSPLIYARQLGAKPNNDKYNDYFTIHMVTGEVKKIATAPRGMGVSVSADDSKLFGLYEQPTEVKAPTPDIFSYRHSLKIPMQIFVIDLQTGISKPVLQTTEWINHVQTSPSDSNYIMYCKEGPWQLVDRIWTMRSDGSNNMLMHKRTMENEAAGHEFFSHDGSKIIYDLQTPKGEMYWLATYDLKTQTGTRYSLKKEERSTHFNVSNDGTLFAGDGYGLIDNTAEQAIYLYRPDLKTQTPGLPTSPDYPQQGVLHAEALCHLEGHNYDTLEPNVRFSPDGKWVIFMSSMFGPTHVFAVSVEKA